MAVVVELEKDALAVCACRFPKSLKSSSTSLSKVLYSLIKMKHQDHR